MNTGKPPFLRWAGGKRWIASALAPALREVLRARYIEPFLGSGAVFFELQPQISILSDLNKDLIELYKVVRANPETLEYRLATIPVNKDIYYSIRAQTPRSRIERALRFLYLNRTCFGGLHRTNKDGKFNVPYGGGSRTPEPVYREHLLVQAAKLLKKDSVKLLSCDFAEVLSTAGEGDVVFCDPTYQSAGRGRFDRYGPTVFSWADQSRLATLCRAAYARGAVVVVMNADAYDVRKLYQGASLLCGVAKRKTIGNKPTDETRHCELVAVLDPFVRNHLWAGLRRRLARYELARSATIAGAA